MLIVNIFIGCYILGSSLMFGKNLGTPSFSSGAENNVADKELITHFH